MKNNTSQMKILIDCGAPDENFNDATAPCNDSKGLKSLKLKRLRHQCISVNQNSINEVTSKMSNLMVDISLANSMVSSEVKREARTPNPIHRPTVAIQRSLSLHEFDDDALPVIMSSDVKESSTPISAQIKSPRLSTLTRRPSFIYGQVFTSDDFSVGETLGFGFFGKAVKVTHNKSGQVMVMKELINCDEEGKKTFLREAAVLRGLNHPGLLKYIGFLYKGKNLHIITEYIPGGTLETFIHTSSRCLTLMIQLKIGVGIASAMEYLHSRQIIHRDLNSPNCLLRQNDSVVVSDFGLSKIILDAQHALSESRKCETLPRIGKQKIKRKRYTVVGNPYWMAPEMIKGGSYDEKVDVYSFGIILCEMIGKVKADPDFLPRLPNFAVDKDYFLEQYCKTYPVNYSSLALLCCEINPDERPSFEVIHKKMMELYLSHSAEEQRASLHLPG